jgi:hypothetical protein
MTHIIKCTGDILAALQYLSPWERIPRDAQSDLKAVSDVPALVDWLRRSSCRVGITMALSMVLAHYSEGFNVEEVTAGFPSETGDFDVAKVLRLMDVVCPYADRVLPTADLDTHIVSQTAPKDAEKEEGPRTSPPCACSMPLPAMPCRRIQSSSTHQSSCMGKVVPSRWLRMRLVPPSKVAFIVWGNGPLEPVIKHFGSASLMVWLADILVRDKLPCEVI